MKAVLSVGFFMAIIIKKTAWLFSGLILIALGLVFIFLPLAPGTLLLAAGLVMLARIHPPLSLKLAVIKNSIAAGLEKRFPGRSS